MIWGCMTYNELGYMYKIQGTVDQHLYIKILREELQETIKYFDLDPSKVIFQCHGLGQSIDKQNKINLVI